MLVTNTCEVQSVGMEFSRRRWQSLPCISNGSVLEEVNFKWRLRVEELAETFQRWCILGC